MKSGITPKNETLENKTQQTKENEVPLNTCIIP